MFGDVFDLYMYVKDMDEGEVGIVVLEVLMFFGFVVVDVVDVEVEVVM